MAFWQPRIQCIIPVLRPRFIQLSVPKRRRYCCSSSVDTVHQKRNRYTVLSSLSSCVGAPPPLLNHNHNIMDDPFLSSVTVTRNQEYLDAMAEGEKVAQKIMKKYEKVFESYSMWMERWSWDDEWIGGPQDVPYLIKWYRNNDGKISKEEIKKMLHFISTHGSDIDFLNDLFHQLLGINQADKEIYASYVVGLLNCQKYDEAIQVFEVMQRNNMNGSLLMYNKLLSQVYNFQKGCYKSWELAKIILNRMDADKIIPDILTYCYLTDIASKQTNEPLSLWIDLIREMRGKHGLKPSLSCYYHLLQILKGVSTEEWIQNYAPGILNELDDGNIDLKVEHPDDLLFFAEFMEMLMSNLKLRKGGEVEDPASLQTLYDLGTELLDYVIDNDMEELTDNTFFLSYFFNFIFSDPGKFSMDTIFEEYSRISKYISPPDERVYGFMLQHMIEKKNIHYLLQVVKDLRKARVSYDKLLYDILKVLLQNGGEVTGNHEQHLKVLKFVYSNMNVTQELISQCIYCLSVWGEEALVDLKLEESVNFNLGSPGEVLKGALLLSQYYGREDITQELMNVSEKHGLDVKFQIKDKDVLNAEMTLTLGTAMARNLASKLECSGSLATMRGKTLTGVVLSRTKGDGLVVELGLRRYPNQQSPMIRRSELPQKGMDYIFSSDVPKGQVFRVGNRIQCSIKDVAIRDSKVFLRLASPEYFD